MIKIMRTSPVFVVVVAVVLFLSGCKSQNAQTVEDTRLTPFVKYSVSGQSASIVSANTPFDDNPKAREAFQKWFKRGLETGLAGDPPLMIEWQGTPEGRAGQRGYDLGQEEGRRFREDKKSPRGLQTVPIPPF